MRQFAYGIGIAPRKHLISRLAPRQPCILQVFALRQRQRHHGRQLQAEYMFGVVGDSRCIAVAPVTEDFKFILRVPVDQNITVCFDTGLFPDLALRGCRKRFARFLTAGYGLPVSRPVRKKSRRMIR